MTSLLFFTVSRGAWAQGPAPLPNDGARTPPPVELGAGAFARYDHGNVCEQDGDVVSCSNGRAFVGAQLAPRYRFSHLFSLGAFAAFGWKMGSQSTQSSDGSHDDLSETTFRLETEARLHLLDPGDPDLWFGVGVGVTWLHQSVDIYGPGDRFLRSTSNTELGPIAGVAFGVDFPVAEFFALGPELRGAALTYGEDPALAVSLALTGTFLASP